MNKDEQKQLTVDDFYIDKIYGCGNDEWYIKYEPPITLTKEKENINKLTDEQVRDIDAHNLPITCNCGCTDTEERNIVWLDGIGSTKCEYEEYCADCGKYLGSFEYGHWTY